MATKFTPGPWNLGKTFNRSVFGKEWEVAGVTNSPNPDEANANARLIAAAPDLYAAAVSALNYIENTECEFGIQLDSGNALRAALARSEAK